MSNKLIRFFFYLYVFFIPMEEILDVFFGVKTFAKPYRIFGIIFLILTFVDRTTGRKYDKTNMEGDKYLYQIYFLGLLITLVQSFFGNVHFDSFYPELIQIFLILMLYHHAKQFMLIHHFEKALRMFYISILCNAGFVVFGKLTSVIAYKRFSGFMENPNMCGFLLNVGFIITFYYFKKVAVSRRYLLVPLFMLLAYAIINTGSRSNFILLALNLSVLPFFVFKTRQAVVSLSLIGLSLLFTPLNQFIDSSNDENLVLVRMRNKQVNENAEDVRFRVFKAGRDLGEEILFTGIGIGQFVYYFPEYFSKYDFDNWFYGDTRGLTLHNYYLTLLIEYSFLGLFLFLIYLFISWRNLLGSKLLKKLNPNLYQLKFILLTYGMILCLFHTGTTIALIWFLFAVATCGVVQKPSGGVEKETIAEPQPDTTLTALAHGQ